MVLPPTIRQLLRSPLSSNFPKSTTTTTTVSGWIKSIRKQKNISFAVITDGSSTKGLQAVLVKEDEDLLRRYCYVSYIHVFRTYMHFLLLLRLTNGAAVRLTGRLVFSPGKEQSCELLVDKNDVGEVVVLGECDPEARFYSPPILTR
jgi:asparaginyl-tRNA synthetase